jgi:glycine/D-amino acid oxidase-like deaminating enzyme
MAARTVIVGAGPAGLAVAALLGQHGASYTVLERADSVAPAWRDRYDGLQLHTVRWLSALPDAPITRRYGAWVRRDDLVAYLEQYARRFQIEPEFGVEVRRIERDAASWRLQTSAGDREAETVVLATGGLPYPLCSRLAGPRVISWLLPALKGLSGAIRLSRSSCPGGWGRELGGRDRGGSGRRSLPRSSCPYGRRPTSSGATSTAFPASSWGSPFGGCRRL